MNIEDGTGSGEKLRIDDSNRAHVFAETVSDLESISTRGYLWTLPLDAVAPSGATNFLYVKNTGVDDIHIPHIRIASSVATKIRMYSCTGIAAGGTDLVVSNRHLGRAHKPDAIVQTGASITGLVAGELLANIPLQAGYIMLQFVVDSHFQIPPGAAVLFSSSVAATIEGFLTMYEEID